MALPDLFQNDVQFTGNATFSRAIAVPAFLTDAMVAAGASVAASKLNHQHPLTFAQTGTASAESRVIGIVNGTTAVPTGFRVSVIAAAIGAATATVDVKKNGTTILSAPVSLTSAAPTAYAIVSGTISVATATTGDVYTVVTTVTAGGGTLPTGLAGTLTLQETAV